ncbi:hypothetical protein [Helicobacter pylori]|uniref:hypothetical protein n=1 Tax=Helicobacter pylori TaxID=210 RepID=UPI00040605D5|nr:hypothetical protein [Helicobacter pylori]
MLNIGCKSVKSVFTIQLKAFKSNAKKQKKAKNDTIFSKLQKKKRFYDIIHPMHVQCIKFQTNFKKRRML